jgi:hypothetical protein
MLKVVHLNTYDGNGGAGRACIRLNSALLSQNINSKVIVHYKFGKNPGIGDFNKNIIQLPPLYWNEYGPKDILRH